MKRNEEQSLLAGQRKNGGPTIVSTSEYIIN